MNIGSEVATSTSQSGAGARRGRATGRTGGSRTVAMRVS